MDLLTRLNRAMDYIEENISEDIDLKAMARVTLYSCLLYTSPSPRDGLLSRMPSSA